ncbi:MAG TPA: glycosyltransferase [Syntrophobacteria bacterium]|nr:glycosyltransferase [Syntrophobacteria bacterium]
MHVVFYCQHVLGIGHFFRSLELARAFRRHRLVLVTGGPRVDVAMPEHVTEYRLPALEMDADFTALLPTERGQSLEEVQEERRNLLFALFERTSVDLFVVELYPFGRRRFGFELLPVLEGIRRGDLGGTRVVCSLRDILVEKKDRESYEARVLDLLNRYFHALLVHADPSVVSLEETFRRRAEIGIPLAYTGFVTPRPPEGSRERLRRRLGLGSGDRLVVASAGGGRVGAPFLQAVLDAYGLMARRRHLALHLFTGPYMAESDAASLAARGTSLPGAKVERFTGEFLSFLAAADLSISMAGYNTCMNLLAAEVPALVWPFAQNQEQRLRAERLAALGALRVLNDGDLEPDRLAVLMDETMASGRGGRRAVVDLDGAVETVRWLEAWCGEGRSA